MSGDRYDGFRMRLSVLDVEVAVIELELGVAGCSSLEDGVTFRGPMLPLDFGPFFFVTLPPSLGSSADFHLTLSPYPLHVLPKRTQRPQ